MTKNGVVYWSLLKWVLGGICGGFVLVIANHTHDGLLSSEVYEAKQSAVEAQLTAINDKLETLLARDAQERGIALQRDSSGPSQ